MALLRKYTRFRAYQLGTEGSSFSYFDGRHFTLIEVVPENEVEASLVDVKRKEHADWDEEFLTTISPSYVVISCGKDNSYNHPHSAALEAYKADLRIVKRTDDHSTLYFVIDADGSCASPTSLTTYKEVKDKIKSLFPGNAGSDSSVSGFFIGGSALPVTPHNA